MKSKEHVEFEIETQIKALEKKQITPKVLLMGDLSFQTLSIAHKDKWTKTRNKGSMLMKYKDIPVIVNPQWAAGGTYRKENEFISVLGN